MVNATRPPESSLARTAGLMILALAVGSGGTWLALRHRAQTQQAQAAKNADPIVFYRNPMNPAITSPTFMKDEMGMDYIPVHQSELGQQPPSKPGDKGKIAFYRNPMNPAITSPVFMKDEMGMDYIPVYESDLKGPEGPVVEGLAAVKIDSERQQLIGLTTAPVAEGPVGGDIRTTARVAVDETRIRHIHVKVDGYVEKLFVDFVGMPVAKDQPLFTYFSPDFVSAQEDYLLALKTQKSLAGGSLAGSGADLLDAARRRMALWDVPAGAIAELERTGEVRKSLTLYSPITGVVTAKTAVEGMRLGPADTPFEITDLATVWGVADVYEPEIRPGEGGHARGPDPGHLPGEGLPRPGGLHRSPGGPQEPHGQGAGGPGQPQGRAEAGDVRRDGAPEPGPPGPGDPGGRGAGFGRPQDRVRGPGGRPLRPPGGAGGRQPGRDGGGALRPEAGRVRGHPGQLPGGFRVPAQGGAGPVRRQAVSGRRRRARPRGEALGACP